MNTSNEINQLISTLAPHRQKQAQDLIKHNWFRQTSFDIQKEALTLPDDFSGFIDDLIERPDEIGELDVLRLLRLSRGNYLLTPIFEVRSNTTNQVFTYEYVSWKMGKRVGAKGVIFLETNGEITHFLVSHSHEFSVATEVYEAIGGLYLHVLNNKPQNMSKKLEQEILFHLGIDELKFSKVIDLGASHTDFGNTNNTSDLFAAVIDISHAPLLHPKPDFRTTHKPVGFEIKVIHINELKHYIGIIKDNYFLSAIARILVRDDLNIPL